ncbi:flagella synthesis protein FlgN [Azotobacter chroococcum]|uniref:flagella synthesis protein FlgN n=1 Tax=Azotobacter chroococcum TaxID=353 RepID=UPI0010AE9442|nr:flagellar protein FlgN [Azotobacter chroococcum]TKD38214.1 flagellar protein FlgN [Azotobacter chroococcum]
MKIDNSTPPGAARPTDNREAGLRVRRGEAPPQTESPAASDLAAAKQALLGELEHLESQRSNAQIKLGYGAGRRGAEQAAREAGCLPAWQQLLELASHAQLLNRLNGDAIRTRLGHNQRILNFLHEAAGHSLYGPDGRSRRSGSLSGLST